MSNHLWHPFTILKGMPDPLKVKKGQGIYLTLEDDREIMDCISSWWVNLHGHAHPRITEAITKQAQELEHVIFAGFTHDPAEQLAERLVNKLPTNLNRVFYSDNGSTAIEIGMKIAYQYWKNIGQERSTFICFEDAYHGDTVGAMSVGERNTFNDVFNDWLLDVEIIPFPHTWLGDEERAQKEDAVIEHLERLLDEHPAKYAGILMEPLIQGAGGMRMCSEEFMQKLHWVNRQFDVLLIFDEVMTGFGRTGDYFACTRAQVQPDIIAVSKGITGGFLPLSATIVSEEVYQAFNSSDPDKTLWHAHSYTANPLGCAAALASLDLLEEDESAFKDLEQLHLENMSSLQSHPRLDRFRVKGTIAAMDVLNKEERGYFNTISQRIKKTSIDHGFLLRPLGNVIYFMPPYCVTSDEVAAMWNVIPGILEEVLD
ncbi:MAG: adenosylmethionine--8-amino-7-oxononanoate transaminase [Bacteroidota bacterium]